MIELLKRSFFRNAMIINLLVFSFNLIMQEGPEVLAEEAPPQVLEPLPSPTPPIPQPLRFFQTLNPDMRVEVNFIGNKTFNGNRNGDENENNGNDEEDLDIFHDRFTLREVELGFQAAVDPYARADVFFSGEGLLGEESEVELEEAFLTLLRLPLGAQVKIGKFRSSFGEINDGDPDDEFPYADRPLVLVNFFGEDGHLETGISANVFVPNPWDIPILYWFGIFNGDNELAFHGGEAQKPVYFTRLELFKEIGPVAGLELGFSFMTGPNDPEGGFQTTMENFHFELEWQHPVYRQYRSFALVGELYASRREGIDGTEDSVGLYTHAQYQFSRRWFITARYDYSQLPEASDSAEWLVGGAVTFQPSRFSQFRFQYNHVESNFAETRDELFFQLLFIIGFERPEPF